jgi:hypothetical protein
MANTNVRWPYLSSQLPSGQLLLGFPLHDANTLKSNLARRHPFSPQNF